MDSKTHRVIVGLALATGLALVLSPRPAEAGSCGNDNLQVGEQCEVNSKSDPPGEILTMKTCEDSPACAACGASEVCVGTVGCEASTCTADYSGCSCQTVDAGVGTDAGVGDAAVATDSGAGTDAGAPSVTCREFPSVDTPFEAGSLIIPMGTYQTDVLAVYGLMWFLLKHGIRVGWVLDSDKTSIDSVDFSVSGSGALVEELDRSDPAVYNAFTDLSENPVNYIGAPFVIPAADADAALQLMYQGTLPEDPAVVFGWGLICPDPAPATSACSDGVDNDGDGDTDYPDDAQCACAADNDEASANFNAVVVHRAKVPFSAPIHRMPSEPPKRIAVLADDSTWMAEMLEPAGLAFAGALGWMDPAFKPTATDPDTKPGIIFDLVSSQNIADGVLAAQDYHVLWLGAFNYETDNTVHHAAFQKINEFVQDSERALVAMDTGVHAMENLHPGSCGCSDGPLMTDNGMTNENYGVGSFLQIQDPASPFTQVGSLSVKGMGGDFKSWRLLDGSGGDTLDGSYYAECAATMAITTLKEPNKSHLIATRLHPDLGITLYIGGHRYPGNSAQHVAIKRMVLSSAFGDSGLFGDENPHPRDLALSTPIVVERYDEANLSNAQVVVFQGTFSGPVPANNTVFNPEIPDQWRYPAVPGHMRAFDFTSLETTDDESNLSEFDDLTSETLWDGVAQIPAAASRTVFTAEASGSVLSRRNICADGTCPGGDHYSDPNVLASALGLADATTDSLASDAYASDFAALVTRIRGGGLGGIDRSTPAYIPPPPDDRYVVARSTMLYVGALDGMIHGYAVNPDIEDIAVAIPSATTDWDPYLELWAFVPPTQLSRLKNNEASVQASPAVADIFGDFVDDSAGGVAGQDDVKEWITLLTFSSGHAVYGIDVTYPDPAGSYACPDLRSACVKGPNPLWVYQPTFAFDDDGDGTTEDHPAIGRAFGTSMGMVKQSDGTIVPMVFVLTNLPALDSDSDGHLDHKQGGVIALALDATTGSLVWRRTLAYSKAIPNQLLEPNLVPGVGAVVDRKGDRGYVTHYYFADLQGRIWQLDAGTGEIVHPDAATPDDPLWDPATSLASDLATDVNAAGGNPDDYSGWANYPISSSVAVYRDPDTNKLHLMAATGGAYWAPAETVRQKMIDLEVTSTEVNSTVVYTFATGERIYTSPVVHNQEVFIASSEGLPDVLAAHDGITPKGTVYRVNISDLSSIPAPKTFTLEMSSSNVAVSKHGKIVITTTEKAAVRDNSDAETSTSTKAQSSATGTITPQLQMWLPQLRRPAACSDSRDNDGDGLTDYGADPNCTDAADDDESV